MRYSHKIIMKKNEKTLFFYVYGFSLLINSLKGKGFPIMDEFFSDAYRVKFLRQNSKISFYFRSVTANTPYQVRINLMNQNNRYNFFLDKFVAQRYCWTKN